VIEGDQVLFSYKDYRDGGQWKTAEVHGVEFIGRFLQHVLLQRLRHIRRYGFARLQKGFVCTSRCTSTEFDGDSLTRTRTRTPGSSFRSHAGWPPSERAEQDEPTRVCRKCKCGKLVLRAQKARPTVDYLMRMRPDMAPESVDGELQFYLPLTGFL
jgi:hypothetical protein